MKQLRLLLLTLIPWILGCQRPIHEISLTGFDAGKQTMKLEYKVFKQKYQDGSLGYCFENTLVHGVGNISHHRITRTAWLDRQFCLKKTQSERIRNDERTRTQSWVHDGKISVSTGGDGQQPKEFTIDHEGPVFIELHPLIYAADLREPGSRKTYPCLYEPDGTVRNVTVFCVGPEEIRENKQIYNTFHYRLQVITAPREFDDYFIDPKTKQILKIQFGQIKFIPTAWAD